MERAGLGKEVAALLQATLAEALEDKLYLPFVEHQSLLGPMLVKAVQQPEFADFLQVVQSYSLTPAKGRPLKEEIFSAREKLVIQRVKEGRTNKEIAQELNVAELTIKKTAEPALSPFPGEEQDPAAPRSEWRKCEKRGHTPPFF